MSQISGRNHTASIDVAAASRGGRFADAIDGRVDATFVVDGVAR